MMRRFWPAALAAVSIVILGSYLLYTHHLVQRIGHEVAIDVRIYSIVQRGILQLDDPEQATTALFDLQLELQNLPVPIVVLNAAGEPITVNNLPFVADLESEAGRLQVRQYAARLAERRPANVIARPGLGEIYFGDPPVLGWLRWIPYLQVGAGVILVLIAFVVMRADMRAHRERLYSAMARELAHQMGTPLSSLAGWIEVLQLPPVEREELASAQRIAEVMQADVERLERVSRRFELIGKAQVLETAAIGDVVAELRGYFAPRLPHLGRGISLRTRVAAGLPPVRANRVLLVWALENIVKNAVDALAGRSGRISIVALPVGHANGAASHGLTSGVRVLIADNGPGIASSVRDRIFEPGVSTKAGGWGVGLSLSRRIIEELHHGRITVQNRASGGTVFEVTLPVQKG